MSLPIKRLQNAIHALDDWTKRFSLTSSAEEFDNSVNVAAVNLCECLVKQVIKAGKEIQWEKFPEPRVQVSSEEKDRE